MSPSHSSGEALHVFLGTKAQYIKTAPLLRLLDEKGIEYRLIDSGQHAQISRGMREELGVRDPDYVLGGAHDIDTIPQAALWSLKLASRLWSGLRLRDTVFGGVGGICVVHGDTPSTFLSVLMAQRAGLRVAHLEAGLTSGSYTHPFPEEIIRALVSRRADILFAPHGEAAEFLRSKGRKGHIVELEGNTSHEALLWAMPEHAVPDGPVMVTMHRVENLRTASRVNLLVETVLRIAADQPVRFVLHGPTENTLTRAGHLERLRAAGVDLSPLLPHNSFVEALHAAPFAITDGGSIQEECAHMGIPTLLWRDRTEWSYGVGENVVVAHYDMAVIDDFLADPQRLRRPAAVPTTTPSQQALDVLLEELG